MAKKKKVEPLIEGQDVEQPAADVEQPAADVEQPIVEAVEEGARDVAPTVPAKDYVHPVAQVGKLPTRKFLNITGKVVGNIEQALSFLDELEEAMRRDTVLRMWVGVSTIARVRNHLLKAKKTFELRRDKTKAIKRIEERTMPPARAPFGPNPAAKLKKGKEPIAHNAHVFKRKK